MTISILSALFALSCLIYLHHTRKQLVGYAVVGEKTNPGTPSNVLTGHWEIFSPERMKVLRVDRNGEVLLESARIKPGTFVYVMSTDRIYHVKRGYVKWYQGSARARIALGDVQPDGSIITSLSHSQLQSRNPHRTIRITATSWRPVFDALAQFHFRD